MHVLLAPGASGGAASLRPHVDGLRARGVPASAIDLPLRRAELAVPLYLARLLEQPEPPSQLVAAGRSYGGRVASLSAAAEPAACAGLICFSYPLHASGSPAWRDRSAHWPAIRVPVLFLSGRSDPFARLDLLERAIDERLPTARLVTYPRVGHSLRSVLDDALDQAAAFIAELERRGLPS